MATIASIDAISSMSCLFSTAGVYEELLNAHISTRHQGIVAESMPKKALKLLGTWHALQVQAGAGRPVWDNRWGNGG